MTVACQTGADHLLLITDAEMPSGSPADRECKNVKDKLKLTRVLKIEADQDSKIKVDRGFKKSMLTTALKKYLLKFGIFLLTEYTKFGIVKETKGK